MKRWTIPGSILLIVVVGVVLEKHKSAYYPISHWRSELKGSYFDSDTFFSPPKELQDPAAIPILVELLRDRNDRVRWRAADLLRNLGPKAEPAIPALVVALKDKKYRVQCSAANALGSIGPGAVKAVPGLIKALGDAEGVVRSSAADALGQIGPTAAESVSALTKALNDEEEGVRVAAAGGLWKITADHQTVMQILLSVLKNGGRTMTALDHQEAAVEVLGLMGPKRPEVIPALVKALQNREAEALRLRVAAIKGLEQFGPKADAAIPDLELSLKATSDWEKRHAAEALWKVTGDAEASISVLEKLIITRVDDSYERSKAIDALGCMGSKASKSVPLLTKLLQDSDKWVSAASAEALKKIRQEAE